MSALAASSTLKGKQNVHHVIEIRIGVDYATDLRVRMRALGISQNALAREMGIQPNQVSRWFNKDISPNMDTVQRIESALLAIQQRQKKEKAKGKKKK